MIQIMVYNWNENFFHNMEKYLGYNLFWWSTLDILLTISNFATTCQLILNNVQLYVY